MVSLLQWRDVMCPCHLQVALPDTEVDLFGQQVLEQSLASGDTVTKAIYFVVLIFCAPFWEEVSARSQCPGNAVADSCLVASSSLQCELGLGWIHTCAVAGNAATGSCSTSRLRLRPHTTSALQAIFRGFLLPSLIRSMAPWTALVLSSIMFALVHFAKQRCIPLAVLGVIKGILYMQTRNLLAPFTLHALWNLFQFIITVQAQ